ncbi:MAG: hypothetical protein JWN45_1315 [Acidobacteriaceae bacterium]|nr:hypothetical protein [Acidobacteriaceae bacterium]
MKSAFLVLFSISLGLLLLSAGCGGSNGTTTTTTTGIPSATKRAFLLNQFSNAVQIVDAQKDVIVGTAISISQPEILVVMSNQKSLVYSGSNGGLSIIDDATESNVGTFATLQAPTESIVVTPDARFAYAALPALGKIAVVDLSGTAGITPTLIPDDSAAVPTIPGVRRLVMTKNGSTILAFSGNSNSVSFVDTANSNAITNVAGLDRPYTAVISSDDTKAYILNCGKECGGTQASVTSLTLSGKTVGTTSNVAAATVGVADSNNLYVAGTDVTANQGKLTVLNLSSLTPSATVPTISDGLHTTIGLGANNKLYIGARACTNSGGRCLWVYDISKSTASMITGNTNAPAFGDVQAITPIKNRSVVYIIQGGVIEVYDTTTDLPQTNPTILVSGKVVDVKEVD